MQCTLNGALYLLHHLSENVNILLETLEPYLHVCLVTDDDFDENSHHCDHYQQDHQHCIHQGALSPLTLLCLQPS